MTEEEYKQLSNLKIDNRANLIEIASLKSEIKILEKALSLLKVPDRDRFYAIRILELTAENHELKETISELEEERYY